MIEFEDKTRGGYLVRIYATDGGGEFPVHGAYWDDEESGCWEPNRWMEGGEYLAGRNPSPLDLIPKRPPVVVSDATMRAFYAARGWGQPIESAYLDICKRAVTSAIEHHEREKYDTNR